jgi:hypothetical protein
MPCDSSLLNGPAPPRSSATCFTHGQGMRNCGRGIACPVRTGISRTLHTHGLSQADATANWH